MRLAMLVTDDESLKFAILQIGVTDVVATGDFTLPLDDKGYHSVEDMVRLRERVEDKGLRLTGIGIPEEWSYIPKIGIPGRDEQIENWCRTLTNMGEAGLHTLGYFFSLRSWYGNYGLRTDRAMPSRGVRS